MLLLISVLGCALFAVSAGGSISQRIVQGEIAQPGEVPSQLSLQVGGNHICGAVAIAEDIVLTAAHCVDFQDYEPGDYTFVCGAHDIRGDEGQVAVATNIIQHENWNANGFGFPNDIAVIAVYPPFQWDEFCQSAKLPIDNVKDYAGKDSIISGWGRLFGNGDLPTYLKKAHIPTISNTDCGKDYDMFGGIIKVIHDFHVCVRDPNQQQGACNGDSGGPLTTPDFTTGNDKVIGLTSFGRVGCDTTVGSVYTRISYYVDWIQKNMKTLRA